MAEIVLPDAVQVFAGERPSRSGDVSLETHGIAPIPLDGRYGSSGRNFYVWFSSNLEVSGVFSGTLAVGLGLGFWPALIAMVLGTVIGALPVAVLARWGPRTGMGQLPLARLPFGKTVAVPALVQWLSSIAWDALVGLFGGQALQSLLGCPFAVGVLIVLLFEGVVGFFGYEVIHQLERWAAPVGVVFFVLLTVKIIQHGGVQVHDTVHGGAAVGAFLLMLAISLSLGISWATYASDYTRYMAPESSSRGVFNFTLAGLSLSYIWVLVLGLAAGRYLNDQTATGVRHLMGGGVLGVFALLAMGVGAVASNAMNDYSGSLAFQAGGVKVRRPYVAALVTVIAFGLTMWMHAGNTSGKFENLVLFTGYWVAPFFAVVLIDWHYRRRSLTPESLRAVLDFRRLDNGWPALVSLLVGFGAMVPFMNTSIVVGPAAKALSGADVSFFVGFLITAVVYYPLRKVAARSGAGETRVAQSSSAA